MPGLVLGIHGLLSERRSLPNAGVPPQRVLQRYDALARFRSRSTFQFKAITRPSTPSRWSIE
jgi:hypothetical protein